MILYIFSQIALTLGLGILGVSYFTKNYKLITIYCIISSALLAIGYGLLGAYTAIGLNILGIIAYIFFYYFKTKNKNNPFYFIAILWAVTIINGIFTYTNWVSLLPTLASLIFYYSVWQKNNLVYKILGASATIFYILYNIMYKSYFGVISQSVLFIIALVGLILYIFELKN